MKKKKRSVKAIKSSKSAINNIFNKLKIKNQNSMQKRQVKGNQLAQSKQNIKMTSERQIKNKDPGELSKSSIRHHQNPSIAQKYVFVPKCAKVQKEKGKVEPGDSLSNIENSFLI